MKKLTVVMCLIVLLFSSCERSSDPANELSEESLAISIVEPDDNEEEDPASQEEVSLEESKEEYETVKVDNQGYELHLIESILTEEQYEEVLESNALPYDLPLYAQVFEYEQFRLLLVDDKQFHIFQNEYYLGVTEIVRGVNRSTIDFYQFEDAIWLIYDYWSGAGTGYTHTRQSWYRLNDDNAPYEALSFITEISFSRPYPMTFFIYQSEIIDIYVEDSSLYFLLEWDEEHRAGWLIEIDGDSHLFSKRGQDLYRLYDSGSISAGFATRFNQYYDQSGFIEGRDGLDILYSFTDEIVEITKSGTQVQREWLADFFEWLSIEHDFASIAEAYEWSLNQEGHPDYSIDRNLVD